MHARTHARISERGRYGREESMRTDNASCVYTEPIGTQVRTGRTAIKGPQGWVRIGQVNLERILVRLKVSCWPSRRRPCEYHLCMC